MMETNYKEGRIDGKVINYYNIGTLESEKNYTNGAPNGTFIFYEKQAGKVKKVIKYKNGKKLCKEEN